METLGFIIVAILGLVALLSFIWLIVIAFKKSVWWGLAVLLFPIAAIIFAVLHWRKSKTPFLTNTVSGIAFIVLLVYMTVSTGRLEMLRTVLEFELGESEVQAVMQLFENTVAHTESSGMNKEPEEELHEILDLARRTLTPQIDENKIKTQTLAPQQDPTGYKPIAITEASNYIGMIMKVVGKNGVTHKGTLKKVSLDGLLFERWMDNGKFTFKLRTTNIKSLRVYR
jgi:hypothetical protein